MTPDLPAETLNSLVMHADVTTVVIIPLRRSP